MYSFIQEVNEESPLKSKPNNEQKNKETSNDSKKSHPYIHECENHKDIKSMWLATKMFSNHKSIHPSVR